MELLIGIITGVLGFGILMGVFAIKIHKEGEGAKLHTCRHSIDGTESCCRSQPVTIRGAPTNAVRGLNGNDIKPTGLSVNRLRD